MMNAVVWAGVVAMLLGTATVVIRRIIDMARGAQQIEHIRDFVDAVAREVWAGAHIETAVEHATEFMDDAELVDNVTVSLSRVRLGEPVDAVADNAQPPMDRFYRLWAMSHTRGLGLAELSERYVDDLDAQIACRQKARSAMAGARLTMIILLSMPIGAVILGQSMGMGCATLLLFSPLGNALLLVGTTLACGGMLWVEVLTVTVLGGVGGRAGPRQNDAEENPLDAARCCDVFAGALDAGLPTGEAWSVAAHGTSEEKQLVSALLALGAGERAWDGLARDPHYGPVARQASQQARSGTVLSHGARIQAARLRRLAADQTQAGAERVLVVIAAPLTLCFLPAFVLVGLIPLVIGLAGI
ncbi:type II secretion system F family protein [Corynebacterium anserum]|uniref:Type II secretion system protein GspF domain-containing protein n=1 Tax=Corynebacterium anserum TaxID=2684406 RepID=A0A7G7YQD2_9CORY|nr:type II secretion system F family protein [Corynebacterium anserum]QNH96702.1 hypothetical protein GP473_08625 [Corynebacterium anserum]